MLTLENLMVDSELSSDEAEFDLFELDELEESDDESSEPFDKLLFCESNRELL